MKFDIFKRDGTVNSIGFETQWASGVDQGDTFDGRKELGSGTRGFGHGLSLWRKHGKREGTNENGQEHVDNNSNVGLAFVHQDSTIVKSETVCGVDDKNCLSVNGVMIYRKDELTDSSKTGCFPLNTLLSRNAHFVNVLVEFSLQEFRRAKSVDRTNTRYDFLGDTSSFRCRFKRLGKVLFHEESHGTSKEHDTW